MTRKKKIPIVAAGLFVALLAWIGLAIAGKFKEPMPATFEVIETTTADAQDVFSGVETVGAKRIVGSVTAKFKFTNTTGKRVYVLGFGKEGLLSVVNGFDSKGSTRNATAPLFCGTGIETVPLKPGESVAVDNVFGVTDDSEESFRGHLDYTFDNPGSPNLATTVMTWFLRTLGWKGGTSGSNSHAVFSPVFNLQSLPTGEASDPPPTR
jgi:hypothetical protein